MEFIERLESQVRSYSRSFPVTFSKALGSLMFCRDGKRFIDFFSGAGVLNYGHNHPAMTSAIQSYLEQDGIIHSLDMVTEAKERFLERLESVILKPRNLDYRVQFVGPTGANGVEAALKLARKVTNRSRVVAFTGSYHGLSAGALSVTANRFFRDRAYLSDQNVSFMPYDGFMGENGNTISYLRSMLEDPGSGLDLPAAVILETVQAEGGVNVASTEWLRELGQLCRRAEIPIIVDDIQAGCGRSGCFFSFERAGLSPDLVVLSKAISGYGLPMTVVLIRPDLDCWKPGEHSGTFRGNNLAFLTAVEALRFWESDSFVEGIEDRERRIFQALTEIQAEFCGAVTDVRGVGLIQGLRFHDPAVSRRVTKEAFRRGLVVECCGSRGEVVKLLPSLIIPHEVLDEGLEILGSSVRSVLGQSNGELSSLAFPSDGVETNSAPVTSVNGARNGKEEIIEPGNDYWAKKLDRVHLGSNAYTRDLDEEGSVVEIVNELPLSWLPDSADVNEDVGGNQPVTILLAAFAALIHTYTSAEEALIAVPLDADAEQPLFVRIPCSGATSLGDILLTAKSEIAAGSAHQIYDRAKLWEHLGIGHWAEREDLFQHICQWGSTVAAFPLQPAISVFTTASADGQFVRLHCRFDSNRIAAGLHHQLAKHFIRVVRALKEDPDVCLGRLELMSAAERRRVAVDFNPSQQLLPPRLTLHEMFECQVAATPEKVAIVHDEREMSYGELNDLAERLASYLAGELRVRRGDRVGIMMQRSERAIAGILGVLKAGAAYVPIDPTYPAATIDSMLQDAGIRVLLLDSDSVSNTVAFDGELFMMDVEAEMLEHVDSAVSDPTPPEGLAYIIYTSGSTGRPKGVAVSHQAITNTIVWRNHFYGLRADDANLQLPAIVFDSSVVDIFSTLTSGGTLVMPLEERRVDPEYLSRLSTKYRVTRFIVTPSYYRLFLPVLQASCDTLRCVTLAGEASSPELIAEHREALPSVSLCNEYGPTENAVCSTAGRIFGVNRGRVSIGTPVSNVKVFVLNADQRLLPVGVTGEIYLAGSGLAEGYWGQEEMTRERFIESPLPEWHQGKMYRTGDLGRWRPDGSLEFVGRCDFQVKVRGYRIELEAIESALLQHKDVSRAWVISKGNGTPDAHLVAFVVTDQDVAVSELRTEVARQLPHYMVPDEFHMLEGVPLNRNGKLDRKYLEAYKAEAEDDVRVSASTNGIESTLLSIVTELFGRTNIGVTENFFEIGGNSIKALEMISKIHSRFDINVSIPEVYDRKTIRDLAVRVGDLVDEREAALVPVTQID